MDIELGRARRAVIKPGYTRHQLATRNFNGCNLSGYFLEGRALNQATFSNADLSWAKLARCSLQNATFRDATLDRTNFEGADLKFADFSGAVVSWPNFNGADLRYSRGLSDEVIELARAQGARLSHAIKKPESHATQEHPQAEETRPYKLLSRDSNKSMAAEIATGVIGLIFGALAIGSTLLSSGGIAWWIVFIIVAGWFFG
jgi:hypothetical protein